MIIRAKSLPGKRGIATQRKPIVFLCMDPVKLCAGRREHRLDAPVDPIQALNEPTGSNFGLFPRFIFREVAYYSG